MRKNPTLGALGYQWSTSRIQQSDLALGALALGALYKRDVYEFLNKFLQIDV